jgi:hypothetical protein
MAPGTKATEDGLAAACKLLPRVEFLLDVMQGGTVEEIEAIVKELEGHDYSTGRNPANVLSHRNASGSYQAVL